MPLDFGIADLLIDEYDRFMRALDTLSDDGQRKARQQSARISTADPRTVTISIPGWDDVIIIRPRPDISPEQKQQHYSAINAGRPSPLAPELQEELLRRRNRWRLMQTSAQPEYAKTWGSMQTALDNVQDLLGTIAVLGRLAIVPAIRALIAADLAGGPILSTTARLALPVFGRLIPIVGLILTAADLLRLLNLFGAMLFPWYAAACTLSKDTLDAGIPALAIGRQIKPTIGRLARSNPLNRQAQLKTSATTRGWAVGAEARQFISTRPTIAARLAARVETGRIRPRFYELIEGAQTMEALFGVGLSLGAIVGVVQENAFAIEQQNRGKTVIVTTQPLPDSMLRDYTETMTGIPTSQLHDLRTGATILVNGALATRVQETFTFEEHTHILAAYSAALSLLRPFIEAPQLEPLVQAALDADLRPPAYRLHELATEVELTGDRRPPPPTWPLPGNPETIRGLTLVEHIAPEIEANLSALLVPRRTTPDGAFLGAVTERIVERLMILFTGSADTIEEQLPDEYRVMESLILAHYWLNTGEPDSDIADFFQRCSVWMQEHRREGCPPGVLRDLAREAGVTLIRMLPPETPLPTR